MLQEFVHSRRSDFLGSAARQRLLAIAFAFDLSGDPIGKWYFSTSLVRRRPAVRVRPWAPNSIAPFPCIFSSISSPQKCGKEMLFCTGFCIPTSVAGHSDRHHV